MSFLASSRSVVRLLRRTSAAYSTFSKQAPVVCALNSLRLTPTPAQFRGFSSSPASPQAQPAAGLLHSKLPIVPLDWHLVMDERQYLRISDSHADLFNCIQRNYESGSKLVVIGFLKPDAPRSLTRDHLERVALLCRVTHEPSERLRTLDLKPIQRVQISDMHQISPDMFQVDVSEVPEVPLDADVQRRAKKLGKEIVQLAANTLNIKCPKTPVLDSWKLAMYLTAQQHNARNVIAMLQSTDAFERLKLARQALAESNQPKQAPTAAPSYTEKAIQRVMKKLETRTMPESARSLLDDEITRLRGQQPHSSDFALTLNYVDQLSSLPWGIYRTERLDVDATRKILDEEHFGLADVKKRVLEFVAVSALGDGSSRKSRAKVMCLVGAPGVGKTSIGESVARALGRDFYRFPVGGLSEVSEIKGHRRTFVGAMPGKIVQALQRTQSMNPVILLDEIDKLSIGMRGDPSAALLEVLDPEQNHAFSDHYLDVPVDLSRVLFMCTANSLDTIMPALLDRMDVVRVDGYCPEEKEAIATQYLVPRALKDHHVEKHVSVCNTAVSDLVRWYTRESGVRGLRKHIDRIARAAALKVVEKQAESVHVDATNLTEFVGRPDFTSDRMFPTPPPGVTTGLAWTASGGAVLYIEAVRERGDAGMLTTGRMGDVMKESCAIALSVARRWLNETVGDSSLEHQRVHVHIPEGAVPKDGPSGGCAIACALLSLTTNVPMRASVAMTGELSLTGRVLPVGGIREKVGAARRSGLEQVLLPAGNRRDWEDLPASLKNGIQVAFAETFEDVVKVAFEVDQLTAHRRAHDSSPAAAVISDTVQ